MARLPARYSRAKSWAAVTTGQDFLRPVSGPELHLGRLLRALVGLELRHRLGVAVERLGPEDVGEGAQRGVVGPHGVDVVAPRHRDPVLRPLKLGLEGEE